MIEKLLLDKFFERLGKDDRVAYKKEDVEKALKFGAVEMLILSQKLPKSELAEWRRKAEAISAKVEIVSTETEQGEQFYNLGGTGALLRYEI